MKKSLLKNTFVRTTFLMLMSALVLTSCKKDNTEPSPASGTDFTVSVCNPIITEGCDPLNHVIDTMDLPYIDIDELIGGGPEKSQIKPHFWADAGCWILDKAGGGLLGGVFSALSSTLTTAIIGPDETQQKLDDILDQLTIIENDINILMTQTRTALQALDELGYSNLSNFYSDFQKLLTPLITENEICEANLKNIYDHLQNYSEEGLNTAVANVMQTWGNKNIYGSSAYTAFDRLYDNLTNPGCTYHGKTRNIFAIYDVIVFHNTPWEKTGYDMRDMFRAAVAAEAVRTAWLTALYYKTNYPTLFESKTNVLKTNLENLKRTFENNKVNRRYDKVVCQLSNALFILDADALEEHKPWSDGDYSGDLFTLNSTTHVFGQGYITDCTQNDFDAARNSQLTDTQISQIAAYYEPMYGRDYTILNCLEDGGLIVPSNFHTVFINNNGDPTNITQYEDIYLLSPETTVDLYVSPPWIIEGMHFGGSISPALFRMSGLYNVGIPLGCINAAGFQCHGYSHDFQADWIYDGGKDAPLYGPLYLFPGDNYEYLGEAGFLINDVPYVGRLSEWRVEGGFFYRYPGKYTLWFKTGSLHTYEALSI